MPTAAIIGGGVIGAGWAARFALHGWSVRFHDPSPSAAERLETVLESARTTLPCLFDQALPAEGSVVVVDQLARAVDGADWVQESVPERLALKHEVLASIEAATDDETIIASSTSGFRPSELRAGARRAERVLVAHPFNPVYLLPLVEVVAGDEQESVYTRRAMHCLSELGFSPLHVRREIDAHVADRLLEAVWREALWLVRDGIATTAEIDDAIRLGFGLRWAQMGLFETYRIAGGEGGMAHFLAQFGPCLSAPWTRLMDVPELDDQLIATIAEQSDAQSAGRSIAELESLRDGNLVAILKALKDRDQGAGQVLNAHDERLRVQNAS